MIADRLMQQEYRHITPLDEKFSMDRNLALEAVRVTEAAALAASRQVGRGDEEEADRAAVDAMRQALNGLQITGTVVIGEGERDEAPMLYIGEQVGAGGPEIDIALDPLEGTTITAKGGQNALAVIAMTDKGGFLNAPDVYMEKLATGPGIPEGILDLDAPPEDVLKKVAKAKGARVEDLLVCILDRPRHEQIIRAVREAGARIKLIQDGDVSAVIATTEPESGIDVYIGTGGAAMHGRPHPRSARVPQRRGDRAGGAVGDQRSQGYIQDKRSCQIRQCDVRRDGRDRRGDASRRAPERGFRDHQFHRHAFQIRHGAPDRGAS